MTLVALLTDFGHRDSYVGEVRAAVLARAPGATVIDVAHDLDAFDLASAALVVERAWPALPAGASLVVVIDPGVGSARRGVAARMGGRWLVGPDNGVLPIAAGEVWSLDRVPRPSRATTFDGRDVFGPAGALLASGMDPRLLGPAVRDVVPSALPDDAPWEPRGDALYARGLVIALDRYGNAVTSLRAPAGRAVSVTSPTAFAGALRRAYAEVAPGAPLALVGSSGRVELARREGRAGVAVGAVVEAVAT
ncbi:MAG: SAM-dependent chlorinase/fluorinase [Polyangiales bacterium]